MAVHPNRPSPQSSSSMPRPEPACRRRKSGRPKARLALAYEREARPGICAPPRLRAAGRGSSRTPSAPKLDHPRQDRQTSDRADCNVTVPSTGAPNGCCRTPATKVLAAAARGDRGSPFGRIQLPKLAIESGEDLIDDAADQPQRMALRHSLFEVDIGKQFTRP